jgi:hypothetical protein
MKKQAPPATPVSSQRRMASDANIKNPPDRRRQMHDAHVLRGIRCGAPAVELEVELGKRIARWAPSTPL